MLRKHEMLCIHTSLVWWVHCVLVQLYIQNTRFLLDVCFPAQLVLSAHNITETKARCEQMQDVFLVCAALAAALSSHNAHLLSLVAPPMCTCSLLRVSTCCLFWFKLA